MASRIDSLKTDEANPSGPLGCMAATLGIWAINYPLLEQKRFPPDGQRLGVVCSSSPLSEDRLVGILTFQRNTR